MLIAVIILNLVVTSLAIALIQRRSPGHLHLLTVVLVSLCVAYPIKCSLLLLDSEGFMTFAHDVDAFDYLFVNLYYFVNVLTCMVAVVLFMRRETRDLSTPERFLHPAAWLIAIAAILIFAYREIYTAYYLDFSLVANEVRRKSLQAQVGYGWITVLMLCGLPLVYLTLRSAGSRLLRVFAVAAFVSVLLVVGSRQYLLAAVLLSAVAALGFSPARTAVVFGGLAAAGALIGMLSWGEDPQYFLTFAVQRFMQTFDGFDLFAAYVQLDRPLLWGATILEDIFITYVPRFIWESKPFLFGSNELVASMFPDLSYDQELMATFPSGFLLEQYANFSFCGALLAFLLFAFLARLPNPARFRGKFVYLGLFAFAPTFFRSGASFITLLLLLTLLAFVIEGLERAVAHVLSLARMHAASTAVRGQAPTA